MKWAHWTSFIVQSLGLSFSQLRVIFFFQHLALCQLNIQLKTSFIHTVCILCVLDWTLSHWVLCVFLVLQMCNYLFGTDNRVYSKCSNDYALRVGRLIPRLCVFSWFTILFRVKKQMDWQLKVFTIQLYYRVYFPTYAEPVAEFLVLQFIATWPRFLKCLQFISPNRKQLVCFTI